ncbi:hypothetical protein [Streptomyces sp. NPDC102476]
MQAKSYFRVAGEQRSVVDQSIPDLATHDAMPFVDAASDDGLTL